MIPVPIGALVSIGGAVLRVIGLNPQSIERRASARAIITPTFGGNDIQLTGADPRTTAIKARTLPQVTGGLDAIAILEAHRQAQAIVPLIRLSSNFLAAVSGEVTVTEITVTEERLHPVTGVGRVLEADITLLHNDRSAGGWLSFGG